MPRVPIVILKGKGIMLHHPFTLPLQKENKIITLHRKIRYHSLSFTQEITLARNLQKHMHVSVLNKGRLPIFFNLR